MKPPVRFMANDAEQSSRSVDAERFTRTERANAVRLKFGVTAKTLSEWCQSGCPYDRVGNRHLYNFDEVAEWMAQNGRTGKAGGHRVPKGQTGLQDEFLRVRIRQAEERVRALELKHARELEKLLSREEVERGRLDRITYVRAKLLAGPAFLFPDDVENQTRLREWVHDVLKEFAGE